MERDERKEIVFYYETRSNPNGDPGFDNEPRVSADGRLVVTDVRLKRTIRDYAKIKFGEKLFVDYDEKDQPTTADEKRKEICGNENDKNKIKKTLLSETFDVPLFGALVPIRRESNRGDSVKLIGPVQFSLGKSVNKVEKETHQITSLFASAESNKAGTIGHFHTINYGLIKFQGAINPNNIPSDLWEEINDDFSEKEKKLFECIWHGTNELITRSKYPQRSILFIEVTYDGVCYNDLPLLIKENDILKKATDSTNLKDGFDFEEFQEAMENRVSKIKKIRIAACRELLKNVESLRDKFKDELKKKVELIQAE